MFVPDEIDETWLYEDEKERLEKGEPVYLPGQEPGENVFILSEDPEDWKQWLDEHLADFQSDIRYRNGKPYGPETLARNLEFERTPHRIRQLVGLELVFRYGIEYPFEPTAFVDRQQVEIEKYKHSAQSMSDGLKLGGWYYHGEIQEDPGVKKV